MPASWLHRIGLCTALLFCAMSGSAWANPRHFESPHIHPLELNLDNDELYAVNTPDGRVSVFDLASGVPVLRGEVRVGIEPCSVRRNPHTGMLWVVGHISDDITVVDPATLQVVGNVPLGDEPTDVAFIDHPFLDDGSQWAVISLSQEDRIVVVEGIAPFAQVGSLDIPAAEPRALAVDGSGAVFVTAFESGNTSTIVPRELVRLPAGPWGGSLPPFDPPLNPDLPDTLMPSNATIAVKQPDGTWLDEQGGDWSDEVFWDLPDQDVFKVEFSTGAPVITKTFSGVGTLLEDLVVDAAEGHVWVVGIDSHNGILFEPKMNGVFADNRLVRLDDSGPNPAPVAFFLNARSTALPQPKAVTAPLDPIEMVPPDAAMSFPTEVTLARVDNGTVKRLFVTSIGGRRIAVVNPNNGNITARIPVPEGGSGLVFHPRTETLIMANRFDNSLHLVNPSSGATGVVVPIGRSGWDPTPGDILEGRQFLYTGSHSANGNVACASCHPYGHMDGLGWDLGDPSGDLEPVEGSNPPLFFHPLKGPMVTQTLRGLEDTEPFHWRGDRENFQAFNGAFASLLGGTELSSSEMDLYTTFMLSVIYPGNPFLDLRDNLPTNLNGGDATVGEQVFTQLNSGFCQNCHTIDNGGTNQVVAFLGAALGGQPMKVAQLRNMYEKTGFDEIFGPNKRAFGYLHDGASPNLEFFIEFILNEIMVPEGLEPDVEAYLMSFPTGTHAAVGASVMLASTDVNQDTEKFSRYRDLVAAATLGGIDLIAHGLFRDEQRGFLWTHQGWVSDRISQTFTDAELLNATQAGARITYLGVPVGQGVQRGLDRDMDGIRDRDEIDNATDPANPNEQPTSVPGAVGLENAIVHRVTSIFPAPFSTRTTVEVYLSAATPVKVHVYDLRGRRVTTLADQRYDAGRHSFQWDGRDARGSTVASGQYFVRLETPRVSSGRKVLKLN